MATLTAVVAGPPYGTERVCSALRLALVILKDAVLSAGNGQKPPEMPVGSDRMPNCEELLRAAVQSGVTVKACGVCSAERGVTQGEVIDGVQIASMKDLVDWVVASDRTVFF